MQHVKYLLTGLAMMTFMLFVGVLAVFFFVAVAALAYNHTIVWLALVIIGLAYFIGKEASVLDK